jgi:hypothetical protein
MVEHAQIHLFQLFRDLIKRYLCCYHNERQTAKKVKEAQERLRRVSQNFLGTQLAVKPSSILVHQVMGPNRVQNPIYRPFIIEPIAEVSVISTQMQLLCFRNNNEELVSHYLKTLQAIWKSSRQRKLLLN